MKESNNPFEEDGEVIYPRYKDPFAKRTKSVKKMRKEEKKMMKEKQKLERKDQKTRKKLDKESNGTKHVADDEKSAANNNKNETIELYKNETNVRQISPNRVTNGSSTLPPPTSPSSPSNKLISGHQTLNVRTPTEMPKKSPVLPNKRIMELKAIGGNTTPMIPPKTDTTPKKQIYMPLEHESKSQSIARPNTLELATETNQITVQATSPLTRNSRPDDDVTRIRRTPSISKVNKDKKKKNKKLKKRLKKKKKSDRGEETSVLEDQEAMSQVKMRKNQEIARLQKEVTETEGILRNSIVNLVHQRESMLVDMLEKSEMLESKAYDFAQAAQEAKLKEKAKSTCCGFGSKYKVCWYICACERRIKRKKKSPKQGDTPEDIKLLPPRDKADLVGDTEDDCYKAAEPPNITATQNKSDLTRSNVTKKGGRDFTGSTSSLTNRLSHIPNTIRGSLPNLTKKGSPGMGDSEGTFPRRKSSSVSSAQDVSKKPTKKQLIREKKDRERREQSYRTYADAQFEDEERRSRAISLLRMDD